MEVYPRQGNPPREEVAHIDDQARAAPLLVVFYGFAAFYFTLALALPALKTAAARVVQAAILLLRSRLLAAPSVAW